MESVFYYKNLYYQVSSIFMGWVGGIDYLEVLLFMRLELLDGMFMQEE
jgi:hypothetical protein